MLLEAELGPPLLETTLVEGSILYVPRGFAHSTERAPGKVDGFSTSLTVGIQTESMGYTYDKLLFCALLLNGESPGPEELRALNGAHEMLRTPLPLPQSILAVSDSLEDLLSMTCWQRGQSCGHLVEAGLARCHHRPVPGGVGRLRSSARATARRCEHTKIACSTQQFLASSGRRCGPAVTARLCIALLDGADSLRGVSLRNSGIPSTLHISVVGLASQHEDAPSNSGVCNVRRDHC